LSTETELEKNERSLKRAKRKAKRIFSANNYRDQNPKCCDNCANSDRSTVEDPLQCDLAANPEWIVNEVDPFGICDKYKPGGI
jgi:hypothetical protein